MTSTERTSGAIQASATSSSNTYPPAILQLLANPNDTLGPRLGLISYNQFPGGYFGERWRKNDMGQGPGAIQWLMVNMTSNGSPSVVQLWDNRGKLGIIVYTPQSDGSYKHTWSGHMGQPAGAVKWLTADMDGTGKSSIVQLSKGNTGLLGVTVYSPQSNGSIKQTWHTDNIGEGAGAVAWLTVDLDNSGKTSIVQLWKKTNPQGSLGMIVYSPHRDGSFKRSWRSGNMQAELGPGAIAWLTVNMDNSGKTAIIQLWDNNSRLGMTVYSPQRNGGFERTWSISDIGPSSSVSWQTVDLDNSGKTSIVRLWKNGSSLGVTVYSPQRDGSFKKIWSTGNIGNGPGADAKAWLTFTADTDSKTYILQIWQNGSSLEMIGYAPQSDGSFKTTCGSPSVRGGPTTKAWLSTRPYSPLRRHTSSISVSSTIAIYRGKLNWGSQTENESFTVILPQGTSVRRNDPIHLYWKWSKGDYVFCQTVIYSVTATSKDEKEVLFSCIWNNRYIFDITFRESGAQLLVVMRDTQTDTLRTFPVEVIHGRIKGESSSYAMVLQKHAKEELENEGRSSGKHTEVYAGLFNFFDFGKQEVFVLVLPEGLADGLPVSVHGMYTRTADGQCKVNFDSERQKVNIDQNDSNKFSFNLLGYYIITCTKSEDAKTLSVDFSNTDGSQKSHFVLRLQPIYFNHNRSVS